MRPKRELSKGRVHAEHEAKHGRTGGRGTGHTDAKLWIPSVFVAVTQEAQDGEKHDDW